MTRTAGSLFSSIAAVLIGFLIADMTIVLIAEPALLASENLGGLFSLTMSAVIMYLFVGVYMLFFYLILRAVNASLRLGYAPSMLGVLAAVLGIPFLVLQEKLQFYMLVSSINPNVPYFYVPTVIALLILAGALFAARFIIKGIGAPSPAVVRGFTWPGLVVTAFVVFMIYSMSWENSNVLATYNSEEERDAALEKIPSSTVRASADAPNFIVIAIEAFRRDAFTPENTPFLAELAEKNIWMPNYNVVASATRPSVTSFFTSLYPAQHGAYNLAFNQAGPGQPIVTTKVSDKITALPNLLQANGYETIMVTSNRLAADAAFGFEKVFTAFDAVAPFSFRIPDPEPLLGYLILRYKLKSWKIFKMLLFTPAHSRSYFDAPRLKRTIINEFADPRDRPFLLYVHYIEPHTPYYYHPYPAVYFVPASRDAMYSAYRQELASIDQSIAEIYRLLEEKGQLDNTWILITSDHGEEFLDHGEWGHGKSVYPEVIRVPAILIAPKGHPSSMSGREIQGIVESIDIAPTFAEIARMQIPKYWEGKSLLPLIMNPDAERQDTALSQFNDQQYLWSSAIVSDWQIIFRDPADALTLEPGQRLAQRSRMIFNLADDPLAQTNLYTDEPEHAARLTGILDDALERLETSAVLFRGQSMQVDDEQLEQLRALGYLD